MNPLDEADIEGVLAAVDRLLAGIEAEGGEALNLRQTGKEALESLVELSRNGSAEVHRSDDSMTVTADFFPATGQGKDLTPEDFLDLLARNGVVHGILLPVVRSALAECQRERKVLAEVVVAKGTPAVDACPERWEVLPHLLERRQVLDQKAVFLDFKALSPFVLVKKDELLVTRIPGQAGSQGFDVGGRAVDFAVRTPSSPQPGTNVDLGPDGYRAACDGCFRFSGGRFQVDRVWSSTPG